MKYSIKNKIKSKKMFLKKLLNVFSKKDDEVVVESNLETEENENSQINKLLSLSKKLNPSKIEEEGIVENEFSHSRNTISSMTNYKENPSSSTTIKKPSSFSALSVNSREYYLTDEIHQITMTNEKVNKEKLLNTLKIGINEKV